MANIIDINTSTPREVNITGKWTWHDYYKVEYTWTDAPDGVVLPETATKLRNGDTVAVDDSYDVKWHEMMISDTDRAWKSVCYGNGMFVAVADSTNYFAYSTDGINWTESTISDTSRQWQSVCYGNGKFVTITGNSYNKYFAYSADGIN